ncbi:uncharacterized protein LOC131158321 [Malania oleifera]|uniref:uncharacterized protein LOC131158321 n=1 Tax=Malania oleifera TaxID=397392 RepID=UPI0025AE9E31|nr:uncharacterized protein LOC131158321 [Malania oleifera]
MYRQRRRPPPGVAGTGYSTRTTTCSHGSCSSNRCRQSKAKPEQRHRIHLEDAGSPPPTPPHLFFLQRRISTPSPPTNSLVLEFDYKMKVSEKCSILVPMEVLRGTDSVRKLYGSISWRKLNRHFLMRWNHTNKYVLLLLLDIQRVVGRTIGEELITERIGY